MKNKKAVVKCQCTDSDYEPMLIRRLKDIVLEIPLNQRFHHIDFMKEVEAYLTHTTQKGV